MSYFIISEQKPTEVELQSLKIKHDDEIRYLFNTTDKTITNKSYQVIDENGDLESKGTIVLNNIPIAEDGKKSFEERFLNRARAIESTPGFIAIKVLRPLFDNTYVVLTQWESTQAFKDWQTSGAYHKAHKKRDTSEGLKQKENVVSEKPFHVIYDVI